MCSSAITQYQGLSWFISASILCSLEALSNSMLCLWLYQWKWSWIFLYGQFLPCGPGPSANRTSTDESESTGLFVDITQCLQVHVWNAGFFWMHMSSLKIIPLPLLKTSTKTNSLMLNPIIFFPKNVHDQNSRLAPSTCLYMHLYPEPKYFILLRVDWRIFI